MSSRSSTLAGGTFRSLRSANFRRWFIGQSVSQTGYWVQLVAQSLLVLRLTDSGTVLGFAAALQFLPVILVSPLAGVLSDRMEKRRLLAVTQTIMMLTAFVLGGLELADRATVPAVLILAGITGTAFAFDQPARRTIVTELVDESDAVNAVSLNGAMGNAAKIVGPAVAGVVIATLGLGVCFIINGATSIAVLVALARLDGSSIRRSEPIPRSPGQIREGFHYVWTERDIRIPLLMLVPMAALAFNWNVLLPLLVTRDLDGSPAAFSLIMVVMSVGSIGGTLWLARQPPGDVRFLAIASLAFGASTLLLSLAPSLLLAALASMLVGASAMLVFNGSIVRLQLGAVAELRGRVMAIFSMVILGSHGVGGPLAGWVADEFGARIALGLGAVAGLVVGAVALGMPHLADRRTVLTAAPPRSDRETTVV